MPTSELEAAFRRFDPRWLAPAVSLSLLIQMVRAWRWQLELRPLSRVGIGPLWVMVSVAYMLINLLPFRAGEFVRPWLCSRRSDVPAASVVGNLILEKALDTTVISVLFLAALWMNPSFPTWVRSGLLIPVGAAVVLAALVAAALWGRAGAVARFATWAHLPADAERRLSQIGQNLAGGVRIVPSPAGFAAVCSLSFALWLLPVLSSYVMIRAFDFDIPLAAALAVFVFVGFGTALPQAPGMIGTFQYACVLALGLFDVPPSDALAYGLVLNGVQLGTLVLQGTVAASLLTASKESVLHATVASPDFPGSRRALGRVRGRTEQGLAGLLPQHHEA